jgi:hypothetical protein
MKIHELEVFSKIYTCIINKHTKFKDIILKEDTSEFYCLITTHKKIFMRKHGFSKLQLFLCNIVYV